MRDLKTILLVVFVAGVVAIAGLLFSINRKLDQQKNDAAPAAATTSMPAAAAAAMSATATAMSAATTTATMGKLYAQLPRSKGFLIEGMERRQGNVGDFLIEEVC